uniref:Uncharacterized protein n=1 Tax=Anolis carolinensis TaxID=28377 RepID=A0A803T7Y0_ANOCA
VLVYFMCGPRQFFFFQCGPGNTTVWRSLPNMLLIPLLSSLLGMLARTDTSYNST